MSIFSAITSAFTPAGTNAAKSQSNRTANVAKQYGSLFNTSADQYKQFQDWLGNSGLLQSLSGASNQINAGPSQQIKQFSNQASEQAQLNTNQLMQALQSAGFGSGAQQGAAAGQFQNAATQTNQYAQQLYSPEYQQQLLQSLMQLIQGAGSLYGGNLNSLGSGVYGQPQVQVAQSPLASILGSATSLYTSKK